MESLTEWPSVPAIAKMLLSLFGSQSWQIGQIFGFGLGIIFMGIPL
jgi:hypothetical protein